MVRPKYVCSIVTSVRCMATRASESKDVFGTLSQSGAQSLAIQSSERFIPEDADGYDKEEIDLSPRRNAYYYKYEIPKYARQGSVGLRKALELFHQMKSKDRLTPDTFSLTPLIYGCAKAGYTKKAFELYEESRKYIVKPTYATVTCLINACAESPFPDYGIKRLNWFLQHIKINYNYTLNRTQYHSAIKAYGKLGQLEEASKLVQAMIEEGISPDTQTFNMLLIGCASNKHSGSSLALRIFKRMKYYGLKPDLVTYRLMLRCIRDCDLGSQKLIKETIGELPALTTFDQRLAYKKMTKKAPKSIKDKIATNFEWVPLITNLEESVKSIVSPTSIETTDLEGNKQETALISKKEEDSNANLLAIGALSSDEITISPPSSMLKLPNLLSDNHLDLIYRVEAIQADKLKSNFDRLILFGGMHGYLKQMVQDGCQPDNKTFSLLLQCIGGSKHDLVEYFRLSKEYSIERDLIFYDLLLTHVGRFYKRDDKLELVGYFIEEMHKDNIHPNISTFEAMALSCDKFSDAKRLLSDINECGFTASGIMINNLFRSALRNNDFEYLTQMISYSLKNRFRPTKNLVDLLEEKRLCAHDIILKYEKNQINSKDLPPWLSEKQVKYFDEFSKRLKSWLKVVELKEDEHPWSQFDVKSVSKKDGFIKFVKKFKSLEKVKQEALEKGENFGNLKARADELERSQAAIR